MAAPNEKDEVKVGGGGRKSGVERGSLGAINVYGDGSVDTVEAAKSYSKYGTVDLNAVTISKLTFNYLDAHTQEVLHEFNKLYTRSNCAPQGVASFYTILFLVTIVMLIYEVIRAANNTRSFYVFIKYIVLFIVPVTTVALTRTKYYKEHCTLIIGLSYFLFWVTMIADKIFAKEEPTSAQNSVHYVLISFLPLRFTVSLSVVVSLFLSFIIMERIWCQTPNQFGLNYCTNAQIPYAYMFQIAFLFIVQLQVYLAERSKRKNFLQLQLMLKQQREVAKEKKKNDVLLKSMLPEVIILKMKNNEELIFDFPEITVMFCQICEFSKIVKHLSPQNTVRLLNIVFSSFDRIVEKHSVYKVETVCEVYMAAAGCPTKCKNHAILAANAALEMQAEMPNIRSRLAENIGFVGVEELKIRIGLNTGAIVAGVIGKKNPRYKLFGDTVNTTSRMESTCELGRIQITQSTQKLLEEHYEVPYRGEIAVKGKGNMRTYFLNKVKDGHKVESRPIVIIDNIPNLRDSDPDNDGDSDVGVSVGNMELEDVSRATDADGKDAGFKPMLKRRRTSGVVEVDDDFQKILESAEMATNAGNLNLSVTGLFDGFTGKPRTDTGSVNGGLSSKSVREANNKTASVNSMTMKKGDSALDKQFQLPEEYKSFWNATFRLSRWTQVEQDFIALNMRKWMRSTQIGAVGLIVVIVADWAYTGAVKHEGFCPAGVEDTMATYKQAAKIALLVCAILAFPWTIIESWRKKQHIAMSTLLPICAMCLILISVFGLRPGTEALNLFIVGAFNISNIPYNIRFVTLLVIPFIYLGMLVGLCNNVLIDCTHPTDPEDRNGTRLISPNVCYSTTENHYNEPSYFKILEFLCYNMLYFVCEAYISAQTEYANRVNAYRDSQVIAQKKLLEASENQVLELLKRMLPASVATALKNNAGVIAENFDEVSILFTDMKGFTAYSSTVTPFELMRFLDRMFSTFDKIADKYNLYKVEIIGDAYFCVSGCPDEDPDHAIKMAKAALALLKEIPALQEMAGTNFELRVGMHIGPVVGGVVGINNPRYHVFGDSVSLANCMESSGSVGRVHVSERVYKKLAPTNLFTFDPCGEEDIPGFGPQVTYFLDENLSG
jgi:class 3 adenylate cyclase